MLALAVSVSHVHTLHWAQVPTFALHVCVCVCACVLQALVQLPYLEHLALAGLGWSHGPISAPHLHTLNTRAAVDKLCLTRDCPSLPNICALEVSVIHE